MGHKPLKTKKLAINVHHNPNAAITSLLSCQLAERLGWAINKDSPLVCCRVTTVLTRCALWLQRDYRQNAVVPIGWGGATCSLGCARSVYVESICLSDVAHNEPAFEVQTGLIAAECDIAQALLNGGSIAEIAAQRGTTENTTRWQTKCLLQKTFTKTQAELVRLLAALSSDFSAPI